MTGDLEAPRPNAPADVVLFALGPSAELGDAVAAALGTSRARHEERDFDGGEHKARPLVSVRNRDAFVISSLAGDAALSANDKLCRALFFVGALKQAAARSVTVVAPYLCYARKDRQTKARDPVTTRYVAQLFEAVGTDRLVTCDVHNLAAFQNASRAATEHLEATQLFVEHLDRALRHEAGEPAPVVVSPDIGGTKRARRLAERLTAEWGLPVGLAIVDKQRSRGTVSGSEEVLGAVDGRDAVVYDDLISSGTTMRRVVDLLHRRGARTVRLLATHGVFTDAARGLFEAPSVREVVVTDSVRQDRLPGAVTLGKLTVLPLAPLLADAIRCITGAGSLTELLRLDDEV